MDRLVGKVKWFSSSHNEGALTSIGGERLDFSSPDGIPPTPFTEGQMVTYRAGEDGAKSPCADDVRARPE